MESEHNIRKEVQHLDLKIKLAEARVYIDGKVPLDDKLQTERDKGAKYALEWVLGHKTQA